MRLYFQGDMCIEEVADAPVSGDVIAPASDGATVIGEGEFTGHRHALFDAGVTLFRDETLATDMPDALYVGHLKIEGPAARLVHEEHATIDLPPGTYRVRRQREYVESMRASAATWGRVVSD